jgi:AmmeMemoRadiSam system protein B/AmmeMemoRadiSam system protein A
MAILAGVKPLAARGLREDMAMKPRAWWMVWLAWGLVIAHQAGCGQSQGVAPSSATSGAKTPQKVRPPAVAGQFYEGDKEKLARQVDNLLAEVKQPTVPRLRGLVCPHAGYAYSGPVAAVAYNQLFGRNFETVIILAASHTARYRGAYISEVDAYETPLGLVPLSPLAAELVKLDPFMVTSRWQVRRPDFGNNVGPQVPLGEETPDSFEHSLEVQLPFLQRTLRQFSIVPITYGIADPVAIARALEKFLDTKTLLIASSDLSHYHPYERARELDTACVQAILHLNVEWLRQQEACGRDPIITLIELAHKKHWKAKLLDYRNSGDTSGQKDRGVVGYAAIAFYEPDDEERNTTASPSLDGGANYTPDQRRFLLRLARDTITAAVSGRPLPQPDTDTVEPALRAPRACFVTLTKEGRLRGCIGSVFPQEALYRAVMSRARAAALEDHRFPPVKRDELEQLHIEISVLTIPEALEFASPEELLGKLRPGVDGVVLRVGERHAVYLPQVWNTLRDKEEFLGSLAEKAGLPRFAWRDPRAVVMVYQVESFEE